MRFVWAQYALAMPSSVTSKVRTRRRRSTSTRKSRDPFVASARPFLLDRLVRCTRYRRLGTIAVPPESVPAFEPSYGILALNICGHPRKCKRIFLQAGLRVVGC